MTQLSSVPGVADVVVLQGSASSPEAPFDLLVEVPHGADRRADYDALRARLVGDLPADLHEFFHVNTDVGAWQVGRRVAERVVAADPRRRALLIRCRIPRTFVDCNREADAAEGELAKGGLTAGLAPYVKDERDRALLLGLHAAYQDLVSRAFQEVCGRGGFGLIPHTYGPVTLGIPRVDERIVEELRAAHRPEALASWPVRPEVDLITAPRGGARMCADVVEGLCADLRALGVEVVENQTYAMVPGTLGWRWAVRHPDATLCFEIRRDLLVKEWIWNAEQEPDDARVDRLGGPFADAILGWLERRVR